MTVPFFMCREIVAGRIAREGLFEAPGLPAMLAEANEGLDPAQQAREGRPVAWVEVRFATAAEEEALSGG